MRCVLVSILACVALPVAAGPLSLFNPPNPLLHQAQTTNGEFNQWIEGFRQRAMQQGIRAETLNRAFDGIRLNADVIERDRTQNEFSKTLWDYLETAVSDARITNGQRALRDNAARLEQIEQTYRVDRHILLAIWGLESAYGAVRGRTNIVEAMATLAYDGRRGEFFEEQLIAALRILQAGETAPANMVGSWAGAMGHTQFMPGSYLEHAVDGNGDGRRDIWGDDPADALASAANYLAHNGWVFGQPWGVEVRLPDGFDYATARRDNTQLPSDWAILGVVATNGQPVPDHAPASVLLPAGSEGAAFLIFPNFAVLETYNTADSYVIGVGHLADRIAGGAPIESDWPYDDRALTFAERIEMQRLLTAAGFDTQKIDGLVGPLTINAIRAYQLAHDLVPDGYASIKLLERLREG